MKKLFTATFLLLLFASCSTTPTSQSTIICGEVFNADSTSPKVLTLFPNDFSSLGGDRLAMDLSQSGGTFYQKLSMTHLHDLTINYNGAFYTFMAEPSDSIYIKIDAQSKEIIFEGSKARFNTQAVGARSVTVPKVNQLYKFDFDTDYLGVVAQIEEKMQLVKDTLAVYTATHDVDDDVMNYLLDDNLYILANFILGFDRQNESSAERLKLKTHEIFDIYNPQKAYSYMYAMHVSNMMFDFWQSDSILFYEFAAEHKDMSKISRLLVDHTLTLDRSVMRDILLSQSVEVLKGEASDIEQINDPRFLDADNYYYSQFLELSVRPILQPQKVDEGVSITGDVSIASALKYINAQREIENLEESNLMGFLTQRYKGKVLYIDVWATWCGPCIKEMGYAKDLHKIYKDSDDIVFVNLCFESSAESWVEIIEKNDIGGENYFVSGDDAAKLMLSTYKLQGYPSYLLIDRDGALVTNSAQRPSSVGKLSEQLDQLL
ncbi:MAG: TlpA disulfide reductase family protein [Rikenellaceae bacterium]